jgi:hypothetical protein
MADHSLDKDRENKAAIEMTQCVSKSGGVILDRAGFAGGSNS